MSTDTDDLQVKRPAGIKPGRSEQTSGVFKLPCTIGRGWVDII